MATAGRASASGGNSYSSCWMQQNCLVPFKLFQPLGKGRVIPLRLQSTFSLLNKQIHKRTWQSTRSNANHFLMFGCRAAQFSWVWSVGCFLQFCWCTAFCAVHVEAQHCALPRCCLGRLWPDQAPLASGGIATLCPLILVIRSLQLLHFTSLLAWRNSTKIHWPSTQVALKGTKLGQWCCFKRNMPGLCCMVWSFSSQAVSAAWWATELQLPLHGLSSTSNWGSSENLGWSISLGE